MIYTNKLIKCLVIFFLLTKALSLYANPAAGRRAIVGHTVYTTSELCEKPLSGLKPMHEINAQRSSLLDKYAFTNNRFNFSKDAWNNNKQSQPSTQKGPSCKDYMPSMRTGQSADIFTIGNNITAATVGDANDSFTTPPNLNGSVGSEQYILMSYGIIRSFNKLTGEPDNVLNIDSFSFFSTLAADVRISYDRFAKRWYMSCEDASSGIPMGIILVASEDAIITDCTRWHFYTIPMDQLNPLAVFTDYQQLAVDQNAAYINVDTFDGNVNYLGTSSIVFQKSTLLEENPLVTVFSGLLSGGIALAPNENSPVADNFDRNPKYAYIIHAAGGSIPVISPVPPQELNSTLTFWRIVDPASENPTLVGPLTIGLPANAQYGGLAQGAPHKGNLFGVPAYLQCAENPTGGVSAPHVRNHQLYVCHPVLVDSTGASVLDGDRIGVRWYQLDVTGDPTGNGQGTETANTIPAIVQIGTLFDSEPDPAFAKSYFIPAIMTNKLQEMVIECTVSGPNDYTDVVYAARTKNDPIGTLREPVYITHNNTTTQFPYNYSVQQLSPDFFYQRWGDESSLSVDPCNDLDIWSTGEWAAIQNGWGIQATQLSPLNAPKQCISPLAQALINKECGCS